MAQKSVVFIAELKRGTDGMAVKNDLEKLANDLTISIMPFPEAPCISGTTSQATYENIFCAKLKYDTKTVTNPDRGSYTVQEWKELMHATVPAAFTGRIEHIRLQGNFYTM